MHNLNKRIAHIKIPERMRKLKISDEGFPVPWFVPWIDGKPEFRGMDGKNFQDALTRKLCWLCGQPLGYYFTFVIGPMCGITRTTAEPPCHRSCAQYAVLTCPFLTQPKMRRNEKDLPEGRFVAGEMIKRNPGVSLLWTTNGYHIFRDGSKGVLINIGDPKRVEFYSEGRMAVREEIVHSVQTGLPILRDMAKQEGPSAMADLEKLITATKEFMPISMD